MIYEIEDLVVDAWQEADGSWSYRFHDPYTDTYREGRRKISRYHALSSARLAIRYARRRAHAHYRPGPVAHGRYTSTRDGSGERALAWWHANQRRSDAAMARFSRRRWIQDQHTRLRLHLPPTPRP